MDGSLLAGPWFYYKDEKHSGYCQPDFLYFPNKTKTIVIVEAKLTWTPVVENELRELYSPVLEFVYPEYNQLLLAVFRNAAPGCPIPRAMDTVSDYCLPGSVDTIAYFLTQWRL